MICTATPNASEKIRNRQHLSQPFTWETWSKSLLWEQLGIPLKRFLSFLLPCILVSVIVAHHITSRCCCVAGCDCLPSLPPYSPLAAKKADLPELRCVRTEIYLQPYFLSYSVTVQDYEFKNLLTTVLAFKNTFLPLIYSVIHIGLSWHPAMLFFAVQGCLSSSTIPTSCLKNCISIPARHIRMCWSITDFYWCD